MLSALWVVVRGVNLGEVPEQNNEKTAECQEQGALTSQGGRRGAREEKGSKRKGKTITGGRVPPAKADAMGWGLRRWAEMTVAQSRLTLCNPMDCSLAGSSVHGISQARILEWVAISFSRGSSPSRDRTQVSHTAGQRFTI